MSYITREDGQHFVIPSYRDVLTVKQKSQLKKEILALSNSYGEYITLQKKGMQQYEVAFSSDTGYLLGESIWHHFKKPLDLIYCEAIPNTTEAILVIVKSGSVYLDGSFPVDSIPEELVIFLTQQNNFEIYTYGDVPISKEPEAEKFSFEPGSVKSFTVLDHPVFPTLALLKIYQLRLVDTVLKDQGIGVLPIRQAVTGVIFLGLLWFMYSWWANRPPPPPPPAQVINPFQPFMETLATPAPDEELLKLVDAATLFLQISGWSAHDINYASGVVSARLLSNGGTMADLYTFAKAHQATVSIGSSGVGISMSLSLKKRPVPNKIYSVQKVVAAVIDRVAAVLPGNNLTLAAVEKKNVYSVEKVTINLTAVSPGVLGLLGKQLAELPLVLNEVKLTADDSGNLTGSITLDALGS
jgi:hypothetical protein